MSKLLRYSSHAGIATHYIKDNLDQLEDKLATNEDPGQVLDSLAVTNSGPSYVDDLSLFDEIYQGDNIERMKHIAQIKAEVCPFDDQSILPLFCSRVIAEI